MAAHPQPIATANPTMAFVSSRNNPYPSYRLLAHVHGLSPYLHPH